MTEPKAEYYTTNNERRLIEYYRRGQDNRWVACLAASRVVGKYKKGETLHLAQAMSITVSQVENLAMAGRVYRILMKCKPTIKRDTGQTLSEIRRNTSPTHFAAIGDLCGKYEMFSLAEGINSLAVAASEHASVTQMRNAIVGEYGGDGKTWQCYLDELIKACDKLKGAFGVPAYIQDLIIEFEGLLKGHAPHAKKD